MALNIGITGSKGFIGRHLVKHLIKNNHHVRQQNRERQHLDNIQSLKTFVQKQDIIFHLAGVNRPQNPLDNFHINTAGTAGLVEAIKAFGSKKTKLIFLSTNQVYSPRKKAYTEAEHSPASIHGWSKYFAEEIIQASGIDYSIIRSTNVYGTGAKPNYNSVVATFIYQAKKGQDLVLENNGSDQKDFIYIDDLLAALSLAMQLPSGIYNVGSGKLTSIKTLAKLILQQTASQAQVKQIQGQNISQFVLGSTQKIQNHGWKPKHNLKQGIKCTASSP